MWNTFYRLAAEKCCINISNFTLFFFSMQVTFLCKHCSKAQSSTWSTWCSCHRATSVTSVSVFVGYDASLFFSWRGWNVPQAVINMSSQAGSIEKCLVSFHIAHIYPYRTTKVSLHGYHTKNNHNCQCPDCSWSLKGPGVVLTRQTSQGRLENVHVERGEKAKQLDLCSVAEDVSLPNSELEHVEFWVWNSRRLWNKCMNLTPLPPEGPWTLLPDSQMF